MAAVAQGYRGRPLTLRLAGWILVWYSVLGQGTEPLDAPC